MISVVVIELLFSPTATIHSVTNDGRCNHNHCVLRAAWSAYVD